MTKRFLTFTLPLVVLLGLLGAGGWLGRDGAPQAALLTRNGLALFQAQTAPLNAQSCYQDQQRTLLATRAGATGDGRYAMTLYYCPAQDAIFGSFSLLETNQPLPAGACIYIQNDTTASGGQSGFQLVCPHRVAAGGDVATAPARDDGHPWQACWIDYSQRTPRPDCTVWKTVS